MSLNLEIQTLGKDQVLGWSWLISPFKWTFQAMPEEDSELLMFDGATILERCEQEPRLGYELLKKFMESSWICLIPHTKVVMLVDSLERTRLDKRREGSAQQYAHYRQCVKSPIS